jgi:hypothetical protein
MFTVEDYIELLTGFKGNADIKLDKSDYSLMFSFAKQIARSTPFTDRQCELAKTKIIYYKDQLLKNDYEVNDLSQLRMPLRSIDRSRWIKIVELNETELWVGIRFIFQKKLIVQLDKLKSYLATEDDAFYDKENKIHYFRLTESNVYNIVSTFKDVTNFEVQEELLIYYEKLKQMKNNKQDYIPGIYGMELKNLHSKSLEYAISSIGAPTAENLCQFYDQKDRFGLHHFDEEDLYESAKQLTPLSKKIINRNLSQVLVNSTQYTINNLAEVILELYRFPLLIVLNEKFCYDELIQFHRAFNGIIPNESCSVLFRLDNNTDGAEFNQYIRANNLNNKVDNNTKIVYISNNKVPKPLLTSNWAPVTAITTSSNRSHGAKTEAYIEMLDLVMHYDSDVSPWKRKQIETL